jgi:chromate transporter
LERSARRLARLLPPPRLDLRRRSHLLDRWRGSAWHGAVETGFAPIAAGLVLAGAFAAAESGSLAWATAMIVAGCRIWRPALHPLLLLSLGATVFTLGRAFA